VSAEVVDSEVKSAVKTLEDLKAKGKEVRRFYGDRAYDTNEVYSTGVEVVVPPRSLHGEGSPGGGRSGSSGWVNNA
jgi:hypothetical protein